MNRLRFVTVIIVPLLSSCAAHDNAAAKKAEIHVLRDRRDPNLEYIFAVNGESLFAQVAGFPGYAERKWYLTKRIEKKNAVVIEAWCEREGTLDPPFVPPGPWFSRATIGSDQNAYFDNSETAVLDFFEMLRTEFIDEKLAVPVPPDWFVNSPDLQRHFGNLR